MWLLPRTDINSQIPCYQDNSGSDTVTHILLDENTWKLVQRQYCTGPDELLASLPASGMLLAPNDIWHLEPFLGRHGAISVHMWTLPEFKAKNHDGAYGSKFKQLSQQVSQLKSLVDDVEKVKAKVSSWEEDRETLHSIVTNVKPERVKAQPCFFVTHMEGRSVFADFLFDSVSCSAGKVQTTEQYSTLAIDVAEAIDVLLRLDIRLHLTPPPLCSAAQDSREADYIKDVLDYVYSFCSFGARYGWGGTNGAARRAMCDLLAYASVCTSTRRVVIDNVDRMARAKAIVTLRCPRAVDLRNNLYLLLHMRKQYWTVELLEEWFRVFERCRAFYASLPLHSRRESWEDVPTPFMPFTDDERFYGCYMGP